ncbi:MAG: NAD-dependent epimerase/dehydratase family protein [Gemmatimonadaceae bacterium]|nr:NAD-dependent epimerase/dehydratase family protein [Gemmatimonadaceae bacterium]
MTVDRRTFLKSAAVAGGALGLHALPAHAAPFTGEGVSSAAGSAPPSRAAAPLRILILGGTGFIGPEQVHYALARGHTVTLFNRGQTNSWLFPNVEKLQGDRNAAGGLDALKGRTWDVVIDNPTGKPQWIVDAAAVLKGNVGHFFFVSSTGVYANTERVSPNESSPLLELSPISGPQADAAGYGSRKARCEQLVEEAFPGKSTIVRPGLIVGPGDLSDRFTYWPWRIERGGEILAPGQYEDPVQWIDVRDLSQWMIRLAESRTTGIFNAVGPQAPIGIGGMLYGIKSVYSNDSRFTWVPQSFLTEQKIRSWAEMPVWTYAGASTYAYCTSKIDKALAAGLNFRPLSETVRDGMAWYHSRPADQQERLRAGLPRAREAEVLAAWRARRGR